MKRSSLRGTFVSTLKLVYMYLTVAGKRNTVSGYTWVLLYAAAGAGTACCKSVTK